MSRPYRQTLIQLGLAESQWLSGDAACLVEDEPTTSTHNPTVDMERPTPSTLETGPVNLSKSHMA
eukprot:scaffold61489_cov71-Attheya_sp.AAC.2